MKVIPTGSIEMDKVYRLIDVSETDEDIHMKRLKTYVLNISQVEI